MGKMITKLYREVKSDQDTVSFSTKLEELQKETTLQIPKDYQVIDVEIAYEDGVSQGSRNSILCDRDWADDERIPRLGVNRHHVKWDRQAEEITAYGDSERGVFVVLTLILIPKSRAEAHTLLKLANS